MCVEMPARLRVTRVNLGMDPYRKSPAEPMLPERREIDSLTVRSRVGRNEIDAEKAVGRMAKRSLEIERHPAALAGFCARAKLEIEEFDKLGQQK